MYSATKTDSRSGSIRQGELEKRTREYEETTRRLQDELETCKNCARAKIEAAQNSHRQGLDTATASLTSLQDDFACQTGKFRKALEQMERAAAEAVLMKKQHKDEVEQLMEVHRKEIQQLENEQTREQQGRQDQIDNLTQRVAEATARADTSQATAKSDKECYLETITEIETNLKRSEDQVALAKKQLKAALEDAKNVRADMEERLREKQLRHAEEAEVLQNKLSVAERMIQNEQVATRVASERAQTSDNCLGAMQKELSLVQKRLDFQLAAEAHEKRVVADEIKELSRVVDSSQEQIMQLTKQDKIHREEQAKSKADTEAMRQRLEKRQEVMQANLQQKADEACQLRQRLKDVQSVLETNAEALQVAAETHRAELASMQTRFQAEIQILQDQVTAQTDANSSKETTIAQTQQEFVDLRKRCEALEADNLKFSKAARTHGELSQQFETMSQEKLAIEQKLTETQNTAVQLEADYKTLVAKEEATASRLTVALGEADRTTQEKCKLEAELKALQEKHSLTLQSGAMRKDEKVHSMLKWHEEQRQVDAVQHEKDLTELRDRLAAQLQAKETQAAAFVSDRDKLLESVAQAETTNKYLQNKLSEALRATTATSESAAIEMNLLKTQHQQIVNEIVTKQEDSVANLRRQLAEENKKERDELERRRQEAKREMQLRLDLAEKELQQSRMDAAANSNNLLQRVAAQEARLQQLLEKLAAAEVAVVEREEKFVAALQDMEAARDAAAAQTNEAKTCHAKDTERLQQVLQQVQNERAATLQQQQLELSALELRLQQERTTHKAAQEQLQVRTTMRLPLGLEKCKLLKIPPRSMGSVIDRWYISNWALRYGCTAVVPSASLLVIMISYILNRFRDTWKSIMLALGKAACRLKKLLLLFCCT
eukprot:GHVT01022465.1.p1 GENE.GHVT01022465.1~~GHVT01022465.1.p1  ORF type:complete len:892 (+),score=151.09 GHVT01022465.1:660-3335(+)